MDIPFTKTSKNQAIKIMNQLSEHPCSKPFISFPDRCSETNDNYFDLINRPMSINLIIHQLTDNTNGYSNVNEWESDVNLIYSNATFFYGTESPIGILAREFIQIFNKKYKNFMIYNNSTKWAAGIHLLMRKIDFLEQSIPRKIKIKYSIDRSLDNKF